MEFLKDLWMFLKVRKKFWLFPIIQTSEKTAFLSVIFWTLFLNR